MMSPGKKNIQESGSEADFVEKRPSETEAAWNFLAEVFHRESTAEDSLASPEALQSNFEHTRRVVNNALRIAEAEGLSKKDRQELEIAAILHDSAKINRAAPGGVDTLNHHINGAELAKGFVVGRLRKPEPAAERIGNAILRHSRIPFLVEQNPDILASESELDLVLRDADILDLVSVYGLRKIVEIRQDPRSRFYVEDKGSLNRAIESAIESGKGALELLATPEAKRIAEEYGGQTRRLLAVLKNQAVNNLAGFKKVFDDFIEKESS